MTFHFYEEKENDRNGVWRLHVHGANSVVSFGFIHKGHHGSDLPEFVAMDMSLEGFTCFHDAVVDCMRRLRKKEELRTEASFKEDKEEGGLLT